MDSCGTTEIGYLLDAKGIFETFWSQHVFQKNL